MRFFIHAHVYYAELWHELADCISSFDGLDFDLWVTTPIQDIRLRNEVLARFPSVHYCLVANRGYDIGPFFYALNQISPEDYEYVVKLHTKRDTPGWLNCLPFWPSRWRRELLGVCSSRRRLCATMRRFDVCSWIGMVARPSVIVGRADMELESRTVQNVAADIVQALGYDTFRRRFVAGSMFIARMECVSPFWHHVDERDFPVVDGGDEHVSGIAHAYERALGYMVSARGFEISDVHGWFMWQENLYGIRRFLLMRVLKPIYHVLLTRNPN